MSLDVWLEIGKATKNGSGIFIRENGRVKEISRKEWDKKFPNTEPITVTSDEDTNIYHGNITHNLARMADKANIYQHLWRPEELDITIADQLIKPLTKGLQKLKNDPEYFMQFNPSNGWGSYETLVEFTEEYLAACHQNPQATIKTWR